MINYFVGVVAGILISCVLLMAISWGGAKPLDDTDNKITGVRSDMRILVDHGTGCQYLRSASGGLTPRLDASGKPMCKRQAA